MTERWSGNEVRWRSGDPGPDRPSQRRPGPAAIWYKKRATTECAPFHALTAAFNCRSAAFFGNCLSCSQALSIASPRPVYYNSMSVKPWDPAQGNADDRRQ